jgi:hypothetical protein
MKLSRPIILLCLLLLFAGPLLLAVALYFGPRDWISLSIMAPYGELVAPPMELPPIPLSTPFGQKAARLDDTSRWMLIYARSSPCLADCVEQFNRLNQVRLALGEDRDGVLLVLLYSHARPSIPDNAEALMGRLDGVSSADALMLLGGGEISEGRIFLADPFGKVLLSYPEEAEQRGIFGDLERLISLL